MKLVPPDWVSEDERDIQRFFKEHPRAAQHVTWQLNSYRDLVRAYLDLDDQPDPSDTLRSLAKKEQAMWRMGIPLLETAADWMELRKQMAKEEASLDT